MSEQDQDRILDGPQFDDTPGIDDLDEDDAYERLKYDQIDERRALVARLGAMIRHLTKHNTFDKQDMVRLLKDAKREIEQ